MPAMDGAEWVPSSWRGKTAQQMAEWEDAAAAQKVFNKLGKLPPLVHTQEIVSLKALMAKAGKGEAFIVQGGDCAERFMDCQADRLEAQLKMMLQMCIVIEHATSKPTCCICRIAGQYGKPRSKPTEMVEGFGEIMSFKGDNINGFDPTERIWDPSRLLQGYFHSAATLNFLRSYAAYAEPRDVCNIKINSLSGSSNFTALQGKANEIKAKWSDKESAPTQFFTSHEAMQLDLEESLTRKVGDKYFNLSAHLVWIGDRTRQLDGAHVEYFRGIANPIGVKVGPSMKNDELQDLVKMLNPNKEEGRLMLITRYGARKVKEFLPGHIEAVQASGVPVVWQCDAVHGNGIVASNKYKTRRYEDILEEIMQCIAVHKRCGTVLGGIHLEASGQESITECLGGSIGYTEDNLTANYETYCDPRLNCSQSIEAAFTVADALAREGTPSGVA